MPDTTDYTSLIQQIASTLTGIQQSLMSSAVDTDLQQLNRLIGQLVQQQSGVGTALPVASGGTGATDAAGARSNLGIGTAGTKAASDDSQATVASVVGTTTAGNIAVFADTAGSVEDGGPLAEGAWIPSLRFGGASVGMTSSANGTYSRIGSMFFVRFAVVVSAKGSSTGVATLGDLPLSASSDGTSSGCGGMIVRYSTLVSISGVPLVQIVAGSATANLLLAGSSASIAMSDANFSDGSAIYGSFVYFA